MAKIDIKDVKELRNTTGLGMMDCKKALEASNGDHDLALEFLKKKGEKVSLSRSDKDANQGKIFCCISDDNKYGSIILLACETDFVAMTDDFKVVGQNIATISCSAKPKDIEHLLDLINKDGAHIKDMLNDLSAKVGEKIIVKSYSFLKGDAIFYYIHSGEKMGTLLSINGNEAIPDELGREISMHATAMAPIAVDFDSVPKDVLEKELSLAKEKSLKTGKDTEMADKIAKGMVEKSINQQVLECQPFVKDPSVRVKDYLNSRCPSAKIGSFVRFTIG